MANAQKLLSSGTAFSISRWAWCPIIYRYTIQGLGFSGLAMFAGVAEMVARAMVGFWFVPLWGYFCGLHRKPGGVVLCLLLPHSGLLCGAQKAAEGKGYRESARRAGGKGLTRQREYL